MFLAGLGAASTGDFLARADVRAQGTTLMASFIVMNIIAIYDKFPGDKKFMARLILTIIECVKAALLIVPCMFTHTGDPISSVIAIPLGFGFGWGYIKTLDKHFSAKEYFLWRRFQIVVTTSLLTYTIVMIGFSWFMYSDWSMYQSMQIRYDCAKIM